MSACVNKGRVGGETGPACVQSTRFARVVPTAMYSPLRIADVRLLPSSPVMMETIHSSAVTLQANASIINTHVCVLFVEVLLRYQKDKGGGRIQLKRDGTR